MFHEAPQRGGRGTTVVWMLMLGASALLWALLVAAVLIAVEYLLWLFDWFIS